MIGEIIPTKTKNNFQATVAPTANSDKSEGYTAGSIIYIPTTGATYICVSNAEGAASWRLLGGEQYLGTWNASTNSPALADGAGALSTYYIVSVAGTQDLGSGSQAFTAGDRIIYNGAIWQKQEGGTPYVPENVANKAIDFSTINDTLYPSVEAVKEQLDLKLNLAGGTVAELIVGDAGTEGSGINIGGVTYESTHKVSDIDGTNYAQTILHRHSTTLEPLIVGARSNSDTSAHANVTAGQNVFTTYGAGWAGSNYKLFASMDYGVDTTGTISNTSAPGRIRRSVTPDGATAPVVFETVNNAGNVAFSKTMQYLQNVNAQTGTTYTLVAADYAKLITINSASAVTFTLPQQSTLTTTNGFWCKVRNLGVGSITFVKEGAETIDGNTSLIQYGEALIERPTTTKWSIAYATATIIEQETVCILGTLTNDKVYDVFSAPDNVTIIGFSLRNTSVGTAGTYTAKIDGTNITGLTTIANSATRTNAAPTALNTMTYQQVLSYVPTGTTSVVDAFISVFYTRNY